MLESLHRIAMGFTTLPQWCMPRLGAELEFYYQHDQADEQIKQWQQSWKQQDIAVDSVDVEKYPGQYEIRFPPSWDAAKLAVDIEKIQLFLQQQGAKIEGKPYAESGGSALHIHLSLHDKEGMNLLRKQQQQESALMLNMIAGLLYYLPASQKYLLPDDSAYKRLGYDLFSPDSMSWGVNNRSVALRIIAVSLQPGLRRIEHRVAAANANPVKVLCCVLLAAYQGIANQMTPSIEKNYGDARMEQYDLPKLANSLKDAQLICDEELDQILLATPSSYG